MAPELVKNANELFCFVTLFRVFRLLLVEMVIFALHPFPALHTTFNLEVKPQTPNPKPQTPNPKPQTPNPKPQTPNPNPLLQVMGIQSVYRIEEFLILCMCNTPNWF